MTSLLAGLVGGLIATIVMTAVMMVMGDGGPPPTAQLLAKFVDGDPEDYAMPGMALHLVYGIVAGVVLAGIVVLGDPMVGVELGSIAVATALGLAYGIALMVVGMGFWMRLVIGMEPDRDAMVTFAVVHVVYGLVLGAFLGSGILA